MTDVPSGGMMMPAHQGYKPPYRATPSSGLSRMVPSGSPGGPARVPNMIKTPPSRNTDSDAWAGALRRAAMFALKELLGSDMSATLPSPWERRDEWARTGAPISSVVTPAGWTLCPTPAGCQSADVDYMSTAGLTSCALFGSCPSGQILPSQGANAGPIGTFQLSSTTNRQVLLAKCTSGLIGTSGARYTIRYQFVRPAGSIASPFVRRARTLPAARGRVIPGALTRPRVLNAARNPWPRVVDGRVAAKPSVMPSRNIEIPPKGPVRVRAGEHVSRPDNAKKSNRVPKALIAASAMFHGLTEFEDAIDALRDALPSNIRCSHGNPDLVSKSMCVINNWDAFLDPETFAKAVGNLIANQVEDKVIGRLMGSGWRTGDVRGFDSSFHTTGYSGTVGDALFGGSYIGVYRNY